MEVILLAYKSHEGYLESVVNDVLNSTSTTMYYNGEIRSVDTTTATIHNKRSWIWEDEEGKFMCIEFEVEPTSEALNNSKFLDHYTVAIK